MPSIFKFIFLGLIILLLTPLIFYAVRHFNLPSKTPPPKTPSATDSATETKWYDSYASSEKEKIVYDIVSRRAKKSETVEIENCQTTPLWLETQQGSKITIVNKDQVNRRIVFYKDQKTINIPANSKISMQVDFPVGKYGYKCDDKENGAVFLVTPK